MRATVSIPNHLAYVGGEAVPDRPPAGQDIVDVIYHTVHGYPEGTAVLAVHMGIPLETLRQKANKNNPQHVFHPRQLLDLMYFTGNVAVLHAMAEHLGYVVNRATPDQSDGDVIEAFMRVQTDFAGLVRAVGEPLARVQDEPARQVTDNEMRRAEYQAQEVHASVGYLLASLRGAMRTEPAEGGAL
jgi:hypothetical protein